MLSSVLAISLRVVRFADENLNTAGVDCVSVRQGRPAIPRYKRPGIGEDEVKERVLKMIRRVSPHGYGVEFRKIRQVGELWEADGSYRVEGKDAPCRFTIRLNSQGAVKFKDIEPP
jgi:hypothetical protein